MKKNIFQKNYFFEKIERQFNRNQTDEDKSIKCRT
jgi:hypothetical protein